MPLDATQQQKLMQWWQSKRVAPQCPSCNQNNWQPGEIINAPVVVPGGTSLGGGIPMVQVICGNCYYVRLYAAVPLGLLP